MSLVIAALILIVCALLWPSQTAGLIITCFWLCLGIVVICAVLAVTALLVGNA